VTRGPASFASEVATVDRGRGRGGANGDRGAWRRDQPGREDRFAPTPVAAQPVAVGPGRPLPATPAVAVSPLRGGAAVADLPSIDPGEPLLGEFNDLVSIGPETDEPALPDEARNRARAAATAPTAPTEANPSQVLHVRFSGGATSERTMEELRGLIRARPGGTRVVLHVPGVRGGDLPMELRSGVAYDAELLAEVSRRLGSGVELQLG